MTGEIKIDKVRREVKLGISKMDFLADNIYIEVKTPLTSLQVDIGDHIKTKKIGKFNSTEFLPWLDKSPVKSVRYRGPRFKFMLVLFVISFIGLGILGALPSTNVRTVIAQILSIIYFAFFLGMPFYTKNDVGPVAPPARVTDSNLGRQLKFLVLFALAIGGAALFAKFV